MKYLLLLGFCFFGFQLQATPQIDTVKVLNYEELKPYLNHNNDTTYVINFWATWCAPCIEELPVFSKLEDKHKDNKLKIVLVSLDFPDQIESRLIPFLKKNTVKPEVIVLDDSRTNFWINEIEESWTGAIPATIIYKGKSREFFERSFNYNDLNDIVEQKLNKI